MDRFLRGKALVLQNKFRDAHEEFKGALNRLGNAHNTLLPVCLYASAYTIIHGSSGMTFTLQSVLDLVERANEMAKKQAFIWEKEGKPLHMYTVLMTLLQKLEELRVEPSQAVLCLNKVSSAQEVTFRVVEASGPPCAGCGLSFKKMMKCSRCKTENYFVCGGDCQRKDWPKHKLVCKPIR